LLLYGVLIPPSETCEFFNVLFHLPGKAFFNFRQKNLFFATNYLK